MTDKGSLAGMIREAGLYDKISQAFAALDPSVGICFLIPTKFPLGLAEFELTFGFL